MNINLHAVWHWFSGAPLHILTIIGFTVAIQILGGRAITRAMNRIAQADFVPGPQKGRARQRERATTTGTLLRSTLNGVLWVIALAMVMSEFGLKHINEMERYLIKTELKGDEIVNQYLIGQ